MDDYKHPVEPRNNRSRSTNVGTIQIMERGTSETDQRNSLPSTCKSTHRLGHMELAAVPSVQVQADEHHQVRVRSADLQHRITHSDHYVHWEC